MFSALLRESGPNAKIAVALAAALWGLYWIPLRGLDGAGLTGAWATVAFYLGPLILCLPIALWRWRALAAGGWSLWLTATVAALSLVFYANALLLTDVVRVVLLYYLTPVWSTLLARVVLGEPITGLRVGAIILGFAGLFTILGIDQGFPIPRGLGDWFALGAGMMWAWTALRLRLDAKNQAEELAFAYFLVGTVLALLLCLVPHARTGPLPAPAVILGVLPWLVPFLLLVVIPSAFLVIWGSRLLDPGLVGVLVLTEISVGTLSAAILTDEPFGLREILGVILVSAAGLLEVAWPRRG